MSSIETGLQSIRRVVAQLGTSEAARLSGVAYTTLHEARKRDFTGPAVETLLKLADFAETYESARAQDGRSDA